MSCESTQNSTPVIQNQSEILQALAFDYATTKAQNERLTNTITEINLALKAKTEESNKALKEADEEIRLLRNKIALLEGALQEEDQRHVAEMNRIHEANAHLVWANNLQNNEIVKYYNVYIASKRVYDFLIQPSNNVGYGSTGYFVCFSCRFHQNNNPLDPFKLAVADVTQKFSGRW